MFVVIETWKAKDLEVGITIGKCDCRPSEGVKPGRKAFGYNAYQRFGYNMYQGFEYNVYQGFEYNVYHRFWYNLYQGFEYNVYQEFGQA